MNQLDQTRRAQVLHLLVEGNSLRSTSRITGVARNTVSKLLCDVGSACLEYQDLAFRNLPCKRIQADEIWSFCYAKDKNLPPEKQEQFGYGDIWTWVAICADTKLVPCWHVGYRDIPAALTFIKDLSERFNHRIQLTTDGHKPYLNAVKSYFGEDIDYACLVKLNKHNNPQKKTGIEITKISGSPDPKHINTSLIERQNLTMRTCIRRFTRKTNGFSKKIQNHLFAVSLHFFAYNFVKVHSTLRETPAMAAGLTDRVWSFEDVISGVTSGPERPFWQSRSAVQARVS